jgi:hypothetical protein
METGTHLSMDKWLTREQIKRLCPPCAESMEAKGITRVKQSAVAKQLAEKIAKTFLASATKANHQ